MKFCIFLFCFDRHTCSSCIIQHYPDSFYTYMAVHWFAQSSQCLFYTWDNQTIMEFANCCQAVERWMIIKDRIRRVQAMVNIKMRDIYQQSFHILQIIRQIVYCHIFIDQFIIFQYICRCCICFDNRLNFVGGIGCLPAN